MNEGQCKQGQFKDNMDMLRIYSSINMQKNVDTATYLFKDGITAPEVKETIPKLMATELIK